MTTPTVLVAVGLDDAADRVVDLAAVWAGRSKAKLVLAHAVPPPDLGLADVRMAGLVPPLGEPPVDAMLQAATKRVGALVERLAGTGLVVESVIEVGDPPSTLLDIADRVGAELIVVGTHGRRGIARVLVGSVAEAVLREAKVPVLVLRTTA